ncbi:MAG TPA: L-2-hydroxyglutarate oxidase, partial [Actinomycetota bacterium]|nr:L-2-hydroxyglutarate oxidase [Actinomycetota bacterium]
MTHDFAVVGGGLVGLAVARELTGRYPGTGVLVLEKEDRWAAHQSGHNSGVLHSGVYYKPGSLKARLCRAGHTAMLDFCRQRGIPHRVTGKVVVATEHRELGALAELERRGRANGLEVTRLGPAELREIEPHAAGIAALRVPEAGVVDFPAVADALAAVVAERGGDLHLGSEVRALSADDGRVTIETEPETFRARALVNCAGLQGDRIAELMGVRPPARIVPFRGEYWELRPERSDLVRALIYPVPDPRFPFLGVHFTRAIDGTVHAGPNAVLSLKREGYRRSDVDPGDAAEVLAYAGFWRFVARFWRTAASEARRSLSGRAFVRSLQRLVPEVVRADVLRGGSGVRAQALARDGRLVDDFLL